MEQRMRKYLLIIVGLLYLCLPVSAQHPTYDDQKEKQWKSMENGPWGFSPAWYYYLLHKKYSGGETYWKWGFLKSGWRVRFKESKSKVKRIMPTRITAEETQRQKMKEAEQERVKMEELYKEEVARAADRNVDLVYSSFKADFDRMQQSIADGLLFCMQRSKGKLKYQVDELTRQNEMICQDIVYIHRTGAGYELENAKRQKAYQQYKKQMEEMVSRVAHLVGMAQNYYKR